MSTQAVYVAILNSYGYILAEGSHQFLPDVDVQNCAAV